eukprot:EG_transcript_1628
MAMLFAFGSHFLPKSLVVPQHGLFCLFELALFLSIMNAQTEFWTDVTLCSFIPSGTELAVVGGNSTVTISGSFHGLLSATYARQSFSLTILQVNIVWPFLAMMGLNVWSVGPIVLIPTAFVVMELVWPVADADTVLRFLIVVIMAAVVTALMAVSVERSRRSMVLAETMLMRQLQASQMADSILNHTLKNILADVAGNLELFLANVVGRDVLEDAMVGLTRGMKSCKERNVYLKLVAGEYTPTMNAVNLREFGQQLIAGRNVLGSFPDLTVYLDYTLLNLVMENGISNALKHGLPGSPNVCVGIEEVCTPHVRPGYRRFRFSVTNDADPLRPALTPKRVRQLFAGHAELERGAAVPRLSEHIGLTHCVLAARVGGFTLALEQEGDRVAFSVELDTDVIEGQHPEVAIVAAQSRTPDDDDTEVDLFPTGLVFAVLDDSVPSQRLLEFHLRKWCAPAKVLLFGGAEGDLALFLKAAATEADIVILDQHLEFAAGSVLGTDVIAELRKRYFRGLICIRSAADSPEDRRAYAACGAHHAIGKDVRGRVMVEELKAAYLRFKVGPHAMTQASMLSLIQMEDDCFTRTPAPPDDKRWAWLMRSRSALSPAPARDASASV